MTVAAVAAVAAAPLVLLLPRPTGIARLLVQQPRRRTAERVVDWGILRLTPKLAADGSTFAWQMTCRHPDHIPCNRTRNVASCASEEECLRMLKQWALFGVECASKADHKRVWSRVEAMLEDGSLPSTAALDAQAVTDIAAYS